MRLALATAFVLIVLPATATKGQSVDALSLQAGARARILGPTNDSQYTLIKVASATPDSLHYRLDHVFETKAVAWQQISKMEVVSGSHSHFLSGVGLGLLVGVVIGALGATSESGQGGFTAGDRQRLGIWSGVVPVLSVVAGAVLGLVSRTEDWLPVTVPGTRAASHRE